MKRLMLTLLLFSVAFCGFSQTNDTSKKLLRTNEIGLDMFDLVLLRTIDVTYEYVKNSDFGFGIAARLGLDPDDENNGISGGEKYSITPFFRYYFYNKQDYGSKGFYAETFIKLVRAERWYEFDVRNTLTGALGIGLGYKYVNHSGFVLDLNLGLGRSGDFYVGRGGIIFGYRF